MFAEWQYEHTKGWANEMNNNVLCSLLFVLYDKSLYGIQELLRRWVFDPSQSCRRLSSHV